MKYNNKVSSSRRKQRKAHFNKNPLSRRLRMRAKLSNELRDRYGVKCGIPVTKKMSVTVLRGHHKRAKEKICAVQRNKYVVYLERKKKDKANGASVFIPFHAHDLEITGLPSKAAAAKLQKRGAKSTDLD